jgi:hypothetical protein
LGNEEKQLGKDVLASKFPRRPPKFSPTGGQLLRVIPLRRQGKWVTLKECDTFGLLVTGTDQTSFAGKDAKYGGVHL